MTKIKNVSHETIKVCDKKGNQIKVVAGGEIEVTPEDFKDLILNKSLEEIKTKKKSIDKGGKE